MMKIMISAITIMNENNKDDSFMKMRKQSNTNESDKSVVNKDDNGNGTEMGIMIVITEYI